MAADQLQVFLDETDSLDLFRLEFSPLHGTEILKDDLLREADRRNVTLLILLDLSATFDIVDLGILLGRLLSLGIRDFVL